METVKFQKVSEKFWTDESGNMVQTSRLTATEKLMEKNSERIYKRSVEINELLKKFKNDIQQWCDEVYQTYVKEKNIDGKVSKGNFTFYNFNRTVKIEVNINERIEFDELGIQSARQLLEEFLQENVQTQDDVIKQLILDAFSTRNGRLDTKKVLNLIRYRSKIKNDKFLRAIELLEESIRKPSSKTYFRLYVKDEQCKWNAVELNFSAL